MQIRQPKAPLLDPRRPEDVSPHRLRTGPDKTQGQQQPLRPDVDPPSTLVEYVPSPTARTMRTTSHGGQGRTQDDQASPRRARKNKRPVNGPAVAKNRQPVVEVGNDEDHEEADMFMTQSTPPLKKHKKNRQRSPSPEAQPAVTVSSKKKEKAQSPQPEEAVTTPKKGKKHKHKKAKAHRGLIR